MPLVQNLLRPSGVADRGEDVSNFFGRRGAAYKNELNRSFAGLLGIATGILSDGKLEDSEIVFLKRWLD
jgi:hypothetical protein